MTFTSRDAWGYANKVNWDNEVLAVCMTCGAKRVRGDIPCPKNPGWPHTIPCIEVTQHELDEIARLGGVFDVDAKGRVTRV